MATSFDPLAIRRVLGTIDWLPPRTYGRDGWAFLHRRDDSSVIVSCAPLGDDQIVHASISHPASLPSYDELKLLHRAVFGDGWAYQVFAPPSDHVNIHAFALHIWGRLDGTPMLPDFTQGSGSV